MSALLYQSLRNSGHCPAFFLFLFSFSTMVFVSPSFAQQGSRGEASSSFSTWLMNIEATAKETFRYNASLHNGTGRANVYELNAVVPEGWSATFRAEGSQVTSFKLDSDKTQSLSIEVHASHGVEPGKYKIPVTAIAGPDTLRLDLEAAVKGDYALELTTPTGLLSGEVTEGSREQIHLTVRNTGTLPLKELELSAKSPAKWDAVFEPSKVERLDPGKSQEITATLSTPDKTIVGDYVTTFTAKNSNASASATFRITVTTSWLAGWAGLLVILLAIGIVYYLVRKYGRR